MSKHVYDDTFMSYTAASASRSATAVVSLVMRELKPESVLDVGCAQGAWLAAWQKAGVDNIAGVDGDYVDRSRLLIPEATFNARDLGAPFDLERTFDLVQSLEVAEHIDAARADTFVANLVRHAKGLLLFSAAVPGQGGEHHVNEQPLDYWRRKFADFGYQPFDAIRPALANRPEVSVWYRYNTLLYVHEDRVAALPESIRRHAIASGAAIADISPPLYRLRKALIRRLPASLQDRLAVFAARHGKRG